MKKIELNVYSFNELDKEIQRKIIERERESEREFFCDYVLEEDMNYKSKELCDKFDIELKNCIYDLGCGYRDNVIIEGYIQKNNFINIIKDLKLFNKEEIESINKYFLFDNIEIKRNSFNSFDVNSNILVNFNNEDYYYVEDLENDNLELAKLFDKFENFIEDEFHNIIDENINSELVKYGNDLLDYFYTTDFENDIKIKLIDEDVLFFENGDEYID